MRHKAPGLSDDEIAFVRALVIHQDDDILALGKPAGLSSQGGHAQVHTLDELLAAFAKPSGARPRLVHRLDRGTSGVILAARSQPAAAFLGRAMMGRRIRKTYLALVAPGDLAPREGAIECPLRREGVGRESYVRVAAAEDAQARQALTRYRVLDGAPVAALVELAPRTGRMHQLRVHLASRGAPIAGDARYGGVLTLAGAPVPRTMLHAAALDIPHPAGGRMRLVAPPPEDFRLLIAQCGLAVPQRWNAEAGSGASLVEDSRTGALEEEKI
ncbi:MAG: RluA family pseudouridine synthase [Caulobacteraceae bacterium]|nr:RluA family pseudouridine synthase [Caulobacteraceae bacterium]